jgi:lipopolysaccharide/colanic/teichoic acid biosynthesis glycosyltransferase
LILYLIKISKVPTKHFQVLFFVYLQSTILVLFILVLTCFLFQLNSIPGLFLVELSIFGFLFLAVVRILKYLSFKTLGAQGYNQLNIVIIADDSSLPFIESHLARKGSGYRIVVIFTESSLIKSTFENSTIILPEKYLGILYDLIEVDSVDEVLYLKNDLVPSEIRETVKASEELGVTLRLRHNDPKNSLSSAINSSFANGKFLSFINIRHSSFSLAIKKSTDINLSMTLIVILSPLLALISILIKLTSKGPLINRYAVTGSRGHQFYLFQFRTTIVNHDQLIIDPEPGNEIDGIESKTKVASRYTKTGKFLQKSGLNELPQLFNVLKGELSMIGYRHDFKNADQ